MYDQLKAAIAKYVSFTEDEYNEVLSHFTLHKVPARTTLVKLDHVSVELYFINTGSIRKYYLPDVEETHVGFFFENSFVSSITSYLEGTPSQQVIETMEECELVCLNKKDHDKLNSTMPKMNEFSRKLIEEFLITNEEQTTSLIFNNSKERFQKMIIEQPWLLKRVSHRYIASYLEIPLLHLSKMIEIQQNFEGDIINN